jgi:hypothetical protein
MSNFQKQVGVQPAPGIEGDFCSTNPRFTVLAGAGALVAGPAGILVGRFAWTTGTLDPDGTPSLANNYGDGPVTGFVHREQQGLIQVYLQETGLMVPAGFPITLFSGGDFWVKNRGLTQALPGQKAYATFTDGSASFAATASPTAGGVATGDIAAETNAFTGSIAGNTLTVTAIGSGLIPPGSTVAGAGVASGSAVVQQLLPLLAGEAALGIGRYELNIGEQTVASEAMTGTYGLFTAASGLTGAFAVGDSLTGSGISTTTQITAFGTGTGGLGTYYVNNNTVVTSTAITAAGNVETKWVAMSSALPGELVKISSQPLG